LALDPCRRNAHEFGRDKDLASSSQSHSFWACCFGTILSLSGTVLVVSGTTRIFSEFPELLKSLMVDILTFIPSYRNWEFDSKKRQKSRTWVQKKLTIEPNFHHPRVPTTSAVI
jgi:hypothetical protein